MKNRIIEIAKGLNIDLIGFTGVDVFKEARHAIEIRMDQGDISPFLPLDLERNTNPVKVWDKAQSIISIGISYKHDLPVDSVQSKGGTISRVAWGKDYHLVLMETMDKLMDKVQKFCPQLEYKAFTDSSSLLDRAIAQRSGLGFYGKNGFVINATYGSYIFLGHILINIALEENRGEIPSECGSCNRCITHCPTGALGEEQVFHPKKCIAYLTQKKGLLTRAERRSMGKNLYGCDICQDSCPFNQGVLLSNEQKFSPDLKYVNPELRDILRMDNKTFKQVYRKTSAGWRGKKNLQRNAIIVAGNLKTEDHFQLLKESLRDTRWDIRLYTMLSLLEYGEKGRGLVGEYLSLENDEFVEKFNHFKI